jgi:pimeloyl-ACP methyl ester carboxylesterase
MFPTALALTGVLVTYLGQREIGREKFQDDGKTLRREITFNGKHIVVTLTRSPRRAVVEIDGKTITREIPAGTVALENGNWQAYALAAEQFPDAKDGVPVKVLLPVSGATIDGQLRVADKGRHVEVTLGPITVAADIAMNGAVTHAAVPVQGVDVRPENAPAPKLAQKPLPAGVVEEPLEIENRGKKVRGVLWRPAQAKGKVPLALFIAGSGPTDRDGNNHIGLRTDSYRMLAQKLAEAGVASIRYDKRGIGASDPVEERDLTIDDYVSDAAVFVARARADARFSKVTIIGHSEGGLIELLLAEKTPVDGLILVAAPGRPLWQIVHEQLSRQMKGAELARADEIVNALRSGKPIADYPKELLMLFRPSIEKFWRSEINLDPPALLAKLKVPASIIQGETDAQVSVEDAKHLAAARKDVHLSLLPRVNHTLKEEASSALPQASYADDRLPLGPGVTAAVLQGIVK